MAKLLFFESDHSYMLDNEIVPSVSEVVRFISREIYSNVNQFNLDRAADRGSKVHKAIENILRYGDCEIDEVFAPYVQAFVKWFKDKSLSKDDILDIEKAYAHDKLLYAGTMDLVVKIDGVVTLVDYKTSATAQKRLWGASENGYRILRDYNCPDTPIERILILHLKNNGTYKEIELPIDDSAFMACLTLHNLMKSTRKKKEKKL